MKRLLILTACFHFDETPIFRLRKSCEVFGLNFQHYGLAERFINWRQAKLERLSEILGPASDEYEYILFTDGFDSFMLEGEDEILRKFEEMGGGPIVSAELNCSPIPELVTQYPASDSPFRFVCGGGFMGKGKDVYNLVGGMVRKYSNYHRNGFQNGNDQIDWTYAFLESYQGLKLDTGCKIFLSTMGVELDKFSWVDGRLNLKEPNSFPSVVHFNGPKGGQEQSQVYMDLLWNKFCEIHGI